MNSEDDLAIGDRVQRAPFHGEESRVGTVAGVYRSKPASQGETIALYVVHWEDTGHIEGGYMRGGLIRRLEER